MFSLERSFHHIYLLGKKSHGLKALMVNFLLSQFGVGMVTGFGVLFLFQLFTDFYQSIILVVTFYIFERLIVAISVPLVAHLVSIYGHRKMMIFGLISLLIKIWLFTLASPTLLFWPLVLAGIFGGISISAYYLPFHTLFLEDDTDSKIGEQMGFITMLGRAAWLAGPALAGFIVDQFSFDAMFMIVILFIALSTLPLLTMKSHIRHTGLYSLRKVTHLIIDKPSFTWSVFFWYFTEAIQTLFWPIFLLAILGNYTTFGIITSAVMVLNSLAVYWGGKKYDKAANQGLFFSSGLVVSISWLMRFIATTPISAIAADSINHFSSPLWWMKIRRLELVTGEKQDGLVFAAAHELVVTAAYILALILGYIILTKTVLIWTWFIPITIMSTLAGTLAIRNK